VRHTFAAAKIAVAPRKAVRSMAAPQFSAPDSVRPSRPKRRFSVAEANRSLPLVKRVVGDIVKTHALAMRLQHEVERQATGKQQKQQHPQPTPAALHEQLDSCMNKLEDFVDELSEIGCELKDYQMGLIDFVGRHEGRDVYLCWKLGEDRITHWHELNAGFAGRKPVSLLKEREKPSKA
jgi:hypothetical protein